MRRSIRSRADAAVVAHRIERDADVLWRAVRHDGESVIRDDEVEPIHSLRSDARRVAHLLSRHNGSARKRH